MGWVSHTCCDLSISAALSKLLLFTEVSPKPCLRGQLLSSAWHTIPHPGRSLLSDGHGSPPWSTGSSPRAQPPVGEAHGRLAAAQRIPRGRGASRSGRAVLGAASSRSAAHPSGPRPALRAPPGMRQRPRSPPRARAGLDRVWGRWSGPRPPALRGLSHLPRAYINAAARVPAALPQLTLRPRAAGVWLPALRRPRLAPRPRLGAPRRRLSLKRKLSLPHHRSGTTYFQLVKTKLLSTLFF